MSVTLYSVQVSIAKQWKEFLDYNDIIGFIFHVSDSVYCLSFYVARTVLNVTNLLSKYLSFSLLMLLLCLQEDAMKQDRGAARNKYTV